MQQKETLNTDEIPPKGRVIGLDPGTRYIGLAVSDELQVIATPIEPLLRNSWKQLLVDIQEIIEHYDAAALIIGLPLNTDGSESSMSKLAREMARKFGLSLDIPVVLQDERVTSYEARGRIWQRGVPHDKTKAFVDSEAASIILSDFLNRR